MKQPFYLLLILTLATLSSCSTTKNIPEGRYLLDNINIESANTAIDAISMENFVRQKPNPSIAVLGKIRLKIYNLAGQDSTKWLSRNLRKIGQAPVIFSGRQAIISAGQMEKELSNRGYLTAKVDTSLQFKDKKASVTYQITSGTPYTVRNYEYLINDTAIARILNRMRRFSTLKPGILFNQEILEAERIAINNRLRNAGYYYFSKENLYYRADTTLNSNQVDLYLSLYNSTDNTNYKRYRIRNVTITSGYDAAANYNKRLFQNPDTVVSQGITIVHGRNNFLRNSTLLRNNYIRPGQLYSDMVSTLSYTAFSGISAIKQADINFVPVKQDTANLIDAQITLAPANIHWFQAGIDGTNSAGDIGIAPSLSYRHQNIFNGAEILGLKLKGAYEFITGKENASVSGHNYYEYGGEISLSFPQFLFPWIKRTWREIPSASTQISLGLTNQQRPEYIRQFFNATYTFRWTTLRARLNHSFDFLDINYVRMPWMSDTFTESLDNPILMATYQDQLIARTGYGITYTTSTTGFRYPRNSFTLRGAVDLAGWLPHLVDRVSHDRLETNKYGHREILGIAYAEYVKLTTGFSQTRNFDRQKSFAYNIAVGFAMPYGNAYILPYEKRFSAGGANSVRGWSTRRLGPGAYKPNESTTFINQVGDIKLDMSVEYRTKVSDLIEIAGFIDAGNVWTIRQYDEQDGGLFTFADFYKEIALSYGLGLRFDMEFLLLRFDVGMKAYDPSRNEGDRFVIYRPKINRDMAWHFAIGYPF
ncbi:translocation and assembly module lipoprotein TamL [Viscerimonas tarda]